MDDQKIRNLLKKEDLDHSQKTWVQLEKRIQQEKKGQQTKSQYGLAVVLSLVVLSIYVLRGHLTLPGQQQKLTEDQVIAEFMLEATQYYEEDQTSYRWAGL
ncbi:MAG: hypothetical protein QF441_03020 [Bacteriovoracaceae bacterium]|jgi:hypothetical protein|nr:hypothetical protein [Halobacteriovoraceae bacterium]MDP7319548.1 hypothetical protein [Bacteriovoracaceae bacterium]